MQKAVYAFAHSPTRLGEQLPGLFRQVPKARGKKFFSHFDKKKQKEEINQATTGVGRRIKKDMS